MSARKPYRTLFLGTLVQESFLSIGGTDDPSTTVDSPFCRDGQRRPTLRGSGIAGALVATLRRLLGDVPPEISGSANGTMPSVWRTFHSHPHTVTDVAFRQHVAIDEKTGAAAEGALFNVETLPVGNRWPFLLEIDTSRLPEAAALAQQALAEWQAGRCWMGREVARGLGWMRVDDLRMHTLTSDHVDLWPAAEFANDYPAYIERCFGELAQTVERKMAPPARMVEITGRVIAGERPDDGYGIDSLSIGGHASDDLTAAWDPRFLAPEGEANADAAFDPDLTIVTTNTADQRNPYIPGSSLRGPLRHALTRLLRSRGEDTVLVDRLFGTKDLASGRLLIRDAFVVPTAPLSLAWLQHHAEDEFAAGAYGSSKFDRVTVVAGTFEWKMVLEAGSDAELRELYADGLVPLMELAADGQLGMGGGQWRGHGWLRWEFDAHALPMEAGR